MSDRKLFVSAVLAGIARGGVIFPPARGYTGK